MISGRSGHGRNIVLPVSLVLTAVYVSLLLLRRHVPSHRFLFGCFFLYTVIVPGYLASSRLVPRTRGAIRALSTIIFGTTIAYATLFVTALFRLDIGIFGLVAPIVILVLAFWNGMRPASQTGGASADDPNAGKMDRRSTAMLMVLAAVVALMILFTGDPLLYTSDSADHIGYIRTISRTHEAFPEQFYYRDGGILTHDIRKGMGQALWGAVNALTGRSDIAAVWPLMSAISSVFVIIALFCAGLLLFESPGIGLVAAILLVVFYDGGLRAYHLAMSAAGYSFGGAFYVAALSFLPLAIARKKPGYAMLAVLSATAAAMTHIAHYAAWLFVAAVFLLSHLLSFRGKERSDRLRRGFLVCGAAFAATLPYIAMRYARDYAPHNALHTHLQGSLYFTDRLSILNPLVYLQVAGPLGILAAVSLILLWKRSRGDENPRLLFNGMVAVYALMFCPLWFPFFLEKMSYLVVRFEFAIPSMLICAYLLREVWNRVRRGSMEMSSLGAALACIAAIVFLGIPLVKIPAEFAYRGHLPHTVMEAGYRNLGDLFASIRKDCPPNAVIASDPITSFGIPAFTDGYAICPYDQHSTPNDSTAIERIIDCRRLFNPWTPMSEIRSILAKYGAEYLVINGRIPPAVGTMYWKPDRETARALAARLHEPASPFRIVYESDGAILARLAVCPTCTDSARSEMRPPFLGDSLDAGVARRLAPSGIPGIRIRDARPGRIEAARGDTLTLHITWVATEPNPFASYAAFLRFDTEFPKGILYRKAYGKPYRKIVEGITRHRYRFRIDFQPLGGIAPPDTWPLYREVHDRVLVAIPRSAAPGTYTISLKVAEKPQYPNYVLKDILTDDDFYNGAVVGTLIVR